MAAGAEFELKFLFEKRNAAKIAALVSAAAGKKKPIYHKLHAIYFDTPDRDLWMRGFTLRVRKDGNAHIQTVKQMRASSIHPGEWEGNTSTAEPDFDLLKHTPLARFAASPSLRANLRPAFEVNVERTSYLIEIAGSTIEASLDRGAIAANGNTLAVCELELELKSGPRQSLYTLARNFVSQAPLHQSLISKAERGYLLAKGAWGLPVKGAKPRLEKTMSCGEAFQYIGQMCLRDFHLNMCCLEGPESVEAIHQGRVAIRRLRAALELFKPMVFDILYRKVLGELKWLGRSLGAARDWDVLKEKLPPPDAEDVASDKAKELACRCEAERSLARQAAIETFNSKRGQIFLLDLAVWIEDGPWQRQTSNMANEPIQGFAGHRLKKRYKSLVKGGAGLADLAPGPRHKLRIRAKELRYMAEFFIGVPGVAKDYKHLKKIIDCCEKLQAALGVIRDEEALTSFMECEGWGDFASTLVTSDPKKELKKAVRYYSQLAAIGAF